MKIGVAEKIIENFMNYPGYIKMKFSDGEEIRVERRYTESIDALIPVWDKIGVKPVINGSPDEKWNARMTDYHDMMLVGYSEGDTIQEAAALATAQTIKAINFDS